MKTEPIIYGLIGAAGIAIAIQFDVCGSADNNFDTVIQ